MTPRLIASDLDGTLLGPDGHVRTRTRAAVSRAVREGVEVVAATGRSRHTALPKLENVEGIRWVICSNGGMIWDRHEGAIDIHRPIAGALARTVMDELRASIGGVALGWETTAGYGFDARFLRHPPSLDELGIDRSVPEPDGSEPATKLFVAHPEVATATAAMAVLAPALPDGITGSTSGAPFLELTADGVDKASTLSLLCERLAIDAEAVMAFGDHHNDLAMLAWAGTGVAMGNTHPDVLAVCDDHGPTNADDGVAQRIEALLG